MSATLQETQCPSIPLGFVFFTTGKYSCSVLSGHQLYGIVGPLTRTGVGGFFLNNKFFISTKKSATILNIM